MPALAASVAAAQVAVERAEGRLLAEPAAEAHEVRHRARRVVGPDGLAGRGPPRWTIPARRSDPLKRSSEVGRKVICGARLHPGTATWTVAGISSVRSWTAAADRPPFTNPLAIDIQRPGRQTLRASDLVAGAGFEPAASG